MAYLRYLVLPVVEMIGPTRPTSASCMASFPRYPHTPTSARRCAERSRSGRGRCQHRGRSHGDVSHSNSRDSATVLRKAYALQGRARSNVAILANHAAAERTLILTCSHVFDDVPIIREIFILATREPIRDDLRLLLEIEGAEALT